MGQVWHAIDERLGREVAVKTVDLRGVTDPSVAERFKREAIATARLSHPSIVTIFDSGTDGHTAFLVMELLAGEPVSDLVRRQGPLSVERSSYIATRVAQALDAAHEIGIVHRDIKPSNVMVDQNKVTLLDFGIAALIGDAAHLTLTQPASTIGTAAYMSPEQALGERPTPASDIYSLGCLLMTMLTGTPPFVAENPISVAHAQIADTPPRVSSRRAGVPWEMDDLVRRMLAKDAASRPSAQAVMARLAGISSGDSPTTAMRPPMVTPVAGPAGTQVMPTAGFGVGSGAGNGVGSAARTPVTGGAAPSPRPPTPSWFTRGIKIFVIVVVVLLLGLVVANAVPRFTNWVGSTLMPGKSASPTPSKTPKPKASKTPTKRPTTQKIPITLPPLPTIDEVALGAAIEGMRMAINQLVPTDDRSADAKDALVDAWESTSEDLKSGDDPTGALGSFADELENQRREGGITTAEYLTLRMALEGVQVLV